MLHIFFCIDPQKKEPMDLKHLHFSLKAAFCLLVVFSVSTSGQSLCSADITVRFSENNTIDAEVTTINVQEGVSLVITKNPEEAFGLNGNVLVAKKVLDLEALTGGSTLRVEIECNKVGELSESLLMFVVVEGINDNPPVFAKSLYYLELDELSKPGTTIEKIEATDLDKDRLYYQLMSPMDEFGLLSDINPVIEVKTVLDYDTTPEVNLILTAQDTPLSSSMTPSYTATTSIKVNIRDINNRPPWFQPCSETTVGSATICLSSGYQGTVNLTEQVTGALPLEPNEVRATDGDKGRNEPISYQILAGNVNGIFSIDSNSGSITMQKPMDVAGPIVLTVMAFETQNPDMFATTSITIEVVIRSMHPPQFVKLSYEGFISEDAEMGSLVLESKTSNKPLQVQATDADFTDGVNPSIKFEVPEDSAFTVTQEGFILMTRTVPPGTTELQMHVVDTTNGEFSTASLSVEVTPGAPTTTTEMPTTTIPSTIITTDMITDTAKTTDMITDTAKTTDMITDTAKTTDMITDTAKTTDMITDTAKTTDMITDTAKTTDMITDTAKTTDMITDTTKTTDIITAFITDTSTTAGIITDTSVTTNMITEQTEGTPLPEITTTVPTSPQTDGFLGPGGDYRVEDMAALGASLAVALLLCLVTIGLLVYHVKRQNSDWRKLSEASIFRSKLSGGSAGPKDGVQFTNEGFQSDEDADSVTAKQAAELPLPGLSRSVQEQPDKQRSTTTTQSRSSNDSGAPAADSTSLSASDNTDSEKEVKPILTKERRVEDGYKAVWFKQDIDPSVKEEVVIIPDSGERDISHDDDDDEEEEEDITNTNSYSTEQRGSDSEDDEAL